MSEAIKIHLALYGLFIVLTAMVVYGEDIAPTTPKPTPKTFTIQYGGCVWETNSKAELDSICAYELQIDTLK
jgi:hypothetical protein